MLRFMQLHPVPCAVSELAGKERLGNLSHMHLCLT